MATLEDSHIDLLLEDGKMDQEKARMLLISCGYVIDPSVLIPECERFIDLIEFSRTLQKKYTKDEIYDGLVSLNGGDTVISEDQLVKFLSAGDRLTDDEVDEFIDCLSRTDGGYCLKEIVNEAYIWDDVRK